MDLNSLINNPEQIADLIHSLQQLLALSQQNAEATPAVTPVVNTKKTTINKKQPSKKIEPEKNLFLLMPESQLHKEDIAIDKLLAKMPPTIRNRPFSLVPVSCRVCGKQESVSPSLLKESASRYKCNGCSGSAG